MARKVVLLQSPPGNPKAKTLANGGKRGTEKKKRVGEVAGGTAAECAAVCCCFPCALMNLLVLAVVKVPASICRKARQRRRLVMRRKQKALLDPASSSCGSRDEEFYLEMKGERHMAATINEEEGKKNEGANDLDSEMWDQFYGTGFWRSPSQKGT